MTQDIDIPERPALTPETAFLRLQAWYAQQQELKALKQTEILERKDLATYYFPEPREGTNRLPLGGGFDLKLGHTLNRKVDEAALGAVTAAKVKKLKLDLDELFPLKPTLSKKAYDKLSDDQRKFVDTLLEISVGTPSMDIVPVANEEGRQAHVAAAEAAAKPDIIMDGLTIVEDAEQAQPGNYYTDGESWWKLTDEYEWADAEDPRVAIKPAKAPRKPRKGKGA